MPRNSVKTERINQIMNGLFLCLLEKPFSGTTLNEIAKKAGINHGMIYYFFKSKENLLLAFIDHTLKEYKKDFLEWMDNQAKRFPNDELLIRHVMDFLIAKTLDRKLTRIFIELWSIANYDTKVKKKLCGVYSDAISITADLIQKNGISPEKAISLSREIIAFIEGSALMSVLLKDSEYPIAEILGSYRNKIIMDIKKQIAG